MHGKRTPVNKPLTLQENNKNYIGFTLLGVFSKSY